MLTMDLGARSSHELCDQIRLLKRNQPGFARRQSASAVTITPVFSVTTTLACHPSTRAYALFIVDVRKMRKQVQPHFCLGELRPPH